MSKLKIIGNDSGIGTFTIISPNSDTDATSELPHSSGTLVTNSQDLIPTQDEIYDLGSTTKKFKDLYLSGSTLNLGNQSISASATGIIVPELQIGTGLGAVKLKASSDGKLKQTSTTVDGIETPEINIPEKLIDLLDIRDTAPTQNDKTLVWSDATSKFEFLTVPEVFSDFTDVDTVTTPPTDTQVLTWNETNNEWSAGNNGFPLTVANITELLALTGMLVGQEAFVVDLNRSYTYTGSVPNDNWRHAVSGWYATDDVMTNHPMSEITGIDSTYSLDQAGTPLLLTAIADDPDQKPIAWNIYTTLNGANVSIGQTDNVLVVSQVTAAASIPKTPVDLIITLSASDDSLDPKFFTTIISAFKLFTKVNWNDAAMVFEIGRGTSTDPYGWTLAHSKSVAINSDGTTLLTSNAKMNRVHVWDRDVSTTSGDLYYKNRNAGGPSVAGMPWNQFPEWAGVLYISDISNVSEQFPNGTHDALGSGKPEGIYGGSMQTRFGYAGKTVALSDDGLTAAVACTGETLGADIWEPDGSEELPYVDIFNRDPQTKIWTRVAHKLSPSAYDSTAMPWTGFFDKGTDLNKPLSVWHSGTRYADGAIATVDTFSSFTPIGRIIDFGNIYAAFTNHTVTRPAGSYYDVTGTSNGTGTGATFRFSVGSPDGSGGFTDGPIFTFMIFKSGTGYDGAGGSGYSVGDIITFSDADLGNSGAPDLTFQVQSGEIDVLTAGTYTGVTGTSSGTGTVGTFDITTNSSGQVTSATVITGGSGHTVGDIITISELGLGTGTIRVGAVEPVGTLGGIIVPSAGMTIALSEKGTTLVVGYRLEGPKLTPHNQYADRSSTDDMVNPYGPGYAVHHVGENGLLGDTNWYNYGAVYIYEKDSNNNWSLDEKLHGNYEAGSFGAAVDIAGEIDGGVDTRRIIVSTPNYNGGLVQVLEKTGHNGTDDVWRYVTNILPPDYHNSAVNKTNNRFGFNNISISKDGTKIAVGDPGQSVTNVIESTAPYGTGNPNAKYNTTGKVVSTNKFISNNTYPAGAVYIYEKTGTSNQWFQADTASDTWALQTNGIVENFIGVDGDGFGDSVDLNHDGSILSVGAPYEHNGFYFPGQQVGSSYIHDYTAKRVFYGWHRFSHSGHFDHPASQSELDAWNYTEATQAINCTVNSSTYIGFVTPPDGKTSTFDLSVSFTSKNTWDNDTIAIVIAFNIDANGKEHTISLIRSGGGIGYNYAIVYNYLQPDNQVIYNGVDSINDTAFVWGSTVATTGEGQFVRNRIVRSGDTFTVTTSQAIDPSNHTGTNSQLDPSTTHTFSLGSYSFGSLFSAANGGARWGFACHSQDLSSWVNVDLLDSINPEEISDTGALHVYQRNDTTSVWDKSARFYPSETFHYCVEDSSVVGGISCAVANGPQKLTDCHMGRLALSSDGKILASGYKINETGTGTWANEDHGQCEIFEAPYADNPPTPIYLAAPSTGVSTIGAPAGNTYIDYENNTSTTITAISTDPDGGSITWSYTTSGNMGSTTITNTGDGTFTFFTPAYAIEHNFAISIIATDSSGLTAVYSMNYVWEYPVVSPNSTVFYESELGGEYGTSPGTDSGTNYTWTCPSDVYFVHALCVGGGGHKYQAGGITKGGGGGGLGWKNNIPVVPGQSYDVRVGRGGHSNYNSNGTGSLATSWFINSVTVQGQGGDLITGGGYIGDGGGKGGNGSLLTYAAGGSTPNGKSGAGGGAGGYAGPASSNSGFASSASHSAGWGGDASASSGLPADSNAFGASNGSDGAGGGGGGGAMNSNQIGMAGGGVGINGQGTNGTGGILGTTFPHASNGVGGSGGQAGGVAGGDFGGGGSGGNPATFFADDRGGGDGVVKLIWGTGPNAPLWPSTNIPQTNPQFQTDAQKGL